MRRRIQQVAGPMHRVQRLELAVGNRAGKRGGGQGAGLAPGRLGRQDRPAEDHRPEGRGADRASPGLHRHRRVRPGAGRWPGRGRGGAGRWRSGHRQVDAAAAGGGKDGGRAAGAVRHRRRVAGAGRRSRAPAGASAGRGQRAGRDRGRVDPAACIQGRPAADRGRLRADPVDREPDRCAGIGQPGARERGAAGAVRQGDRYRRVPGRPRDQGGRHRGSARARAHGRRGAVLRG